MHLTYIISITSLSIFAIIALYIISILKFKFNTYKSEADELRIKNDLLNEEKFENAKLIETLRSKIEYLEKLSIDKEKSIEEANNNAKASLFELGNELSKQLIEIHKKENKDAQEQAEKNVKKTQEQFYSQFEKLVGLIAKLNKDIDQSKSSVDIIKRSLLTPVEVGKLAEITLENILKASGLQQDIDYKMQYTVQNLNDSHLRPDAVIFLPDNNVMVIDAKSSKFIIKNSDNNEENDLKLKDAIMQHLKQLVSKEYTNQVHEYYLRHNNKTSKVMTFMFLPSEHVLERISSIDDSFMEKAWKQNIYPVGPAGLMNVLSLAKIHINDSKRIENYQIILEEVRKLINASSTLSEYSSRIGSNIMNLANNYDKFVASFNGSFINKIKRIQKYGVVSDKKNILPLKRYQIIAQDSEILELDDENKNIIDKDKN